MGIAPLPAFAALDELRDGTLVRVLPQYTIGTREVCILYPSRRFIDARTLPWINSFRTGCRPVLRETRRH